MSYINIPTFKINNIDLDIKISKDISNNIFISESLNYYLIQIKEQINTYIENWDVYKKYTNPYEYIHTNVPSKNLSISKYKPLSRSFYKMIEIINIFNLLNENENIKSFHLAEGPGGFIEAFSYKRKNEKDTYYGITLISDNINIPSWKKSSVFLKNTSNVILEYGESKNGDLFLKKNLIYCYNKYFNSIDYITGDGGFDFSFDFNNQEQSSYKLIFSQIIYAIIMQKKNGVFILKIFDIFKYKTIELLFLLSNFYDNMYIYKPHTSRIANSEKYIICKNYKCNNNKLLYKLIENYEYILENSDYIFKLFNFTIPKLFINKIEETNIIYGQQQIENINTTLNLIKEIQNINYYNDSSNNIYNCIDINQNINIQYYNINNNIDNSIYNLNKNDLEFDNSKNFLNTNISKFNNKLLVLKNINIQKCISWCNKYDIQINKIFID